jgi:hypothetical protein
MSVHRLAGWIHTKRRDWPRAEDGFRRAREFDPESAVLAAAHAQALVGCAEGGRTAPERASIATEARVILETLDEEAMPQQMREDLMERIRAVGGAPTLLGG